MFEEADLFPKEEREGTSIDEKSRFLGNTIPGNVAVAGQDQEQNG